MKRGIKTTFCLLGCVALTTSVRAIVAEATDSNPYHAIVERNVFDLKAPAPPAPPTTVTNTPPPNVKLTGITTILGNKRALFMVQEAPVQGKPQKEESYILTEGQRQGALEVLEINDKTETVKISNDGTVSVLTFEKVKLPNAQAGGALNPAGGPPLPHMPNFVTPQPGNNPFAPGAGVNHGNLQSANNGLTALPTRTLRTGLEQQQQQPAPMSLEEAIIGVEAERIRTQPLVDKGLLPPLPPSPMTPISQGGDQSANPNGQTRPGGRFQAPPALPPFPGN